MRISRDEMFMQIAHIVARRGTCPRARVGAVLVVSHRNTIRSIGYNGNPPGQPHCEDIGCVMVDGHCSTGIHAEINALEMWPYVKFNPVTNNRYTLYVTHKPCEQCMKEILQCKSLSRVVYDIPYRYGGPDNFTEGGVLFERYQEPKLSAMRPVSDLQDGMSDGSGSD